MKIQRQLFLLHASTTHTTTHMPLHASTTYTTTHTTTHMPLHASTTHTTTHMPLHASTTHTTTHTTTYMPLHASTTHTTTHMPLNASTTHTTTHTTTHMPLHASTTARGSFSLFNVGSGNYCLRVFLSFSKLSLPLLVAPNVGVVFTVCVCVSFFLSSSLSCPLTTATAIHARNHAHTCVPLPWCTS